MRYRTGDEITIMVDREGLGIDEGIAHLPDETMVVVIGAGSRVGEMIHAVITGVVQTSLGDSVLASAI
jgi:uncharacterized protein YacL